MKKIIAFFLILLMSLGFADAQKASDNKIIVVDTHADTPLEFANGYGLQTKNKKIQVTIPRLKTGGVGAQYLACYVRQGALTNAGRSEARKRVSNLINLCHKQIKANQDDCELATTAADVKRITNNGKIAFLIGVENGYAIGKDLTVLDDYADRGVTYVTLCHSRNNDICDSSSDKSGPRWKGLSPFGEEVVKKMNQLGLVIDLSHASEETFWDVMEISEAPVVCTHSSVKAKRNHDRNLTDAQLRAIAKCDGVVQVCPVKQFVSANKATASIDDFMAHLLHAIEVAGIDHVGIGTDFDGGGGVKGFNGSHEFPNVLSRLRAKGYSEDDIAKIAGGNYLRVLQKVQSKKTK